MANAISASFVLGLALKSTVLLGAAWIAVRLMRRSSAALRHLVWSMAFASLLLLPLVSAWLPALHVPVNSSALPAGLVFRIDTQPQTGTETVAGGMMPKHVPHSEATVDWGLLLTCVWAGGAALSFAQMLIGLAVIERRRRTAKPLDMSEAAAIACRQLGVRTTVHFLEAEAGSMPVTYGFRRPVIFLPADAAVWDTERLRMVLLHELAHVLRRDGATHLAARTALAFYWWHPLAWSAWREFLKQRERAADDLVLRLGTRASDYASQLLEVASCMQAAAAFGWAGVPMARRSQLESRLSAILDSGCNRKTVGRVSALVVSLFALFIMLPVAAVHANNGLPQTAAANPDSAHPVTSVLVKQADEAREQHQLDQARALYTQALTVSGGGSETAAVLIRLGTLELSAKNYEQSITNFDKAQAADSAKAGEARMWMAIARERENNLDAADALFTSALSAAVPDSVSAVVILKLHADLLRQQSRVDEAAAMQKQADDILKAQHVASTQSSGPDVYRIGSGVTAPIVISKNEPQYTDDARIAKYSGTVLLSVEIGVDGLAENVQVIRPLGLGLDEKATEAVRQWRFKPGTKDGQPVKVSARIEVNFRLL